MEHLSTFGLTRDPFSNEPNLEGWFASPAHLDAERRLARAVRQSKGLVLLLGDAGSGKTLLVRRMLEALEEEMFEACMLVPVPGLSDATWVLDRLVRQLGEEEPSKDPAELLAQLYDQLAQVREDGRHTVLLVDEAQVLADAGVLPALRGLLNLEYEDRRLLTLVLAGPGSLGEAVEDEAGLADRVEARVTLSAMDAESAEAYVVHRIRNAGGAPAILESGAMDALVKLGHGTPRRLNTLADGALFEAHVAGRVSATGEDVERAARELGLSAPPVPAAEPARVPASEPSPEPTPSRGQPEVTTLFVGEDEPSEVEDVLATDTPQRVSRGAADATVALIDEVPDEAPRRPKGRAAAAETVALFSDASEGTEGELDDLFADLVGD